MKPNKYLQQIEKARMMIEIADKELSRAEPKDKRSMGISKVEWIDSSIQHLHEAIDNLLIWKKMVVEE